MIEAKEFEAKVNEFLLKIRLDYALLQSRSLEKVFEENKEQLLKLEVQYKEVYGPVKLEDLESPAALLAKIASFVKLPAKYTDLSGAEKNE